MSPRIVAGAVIVGVTVISGWRVGGGGEEGGEGWRKGYKAGDSGKGSARVKGVIAGEGRVQGPKE